MENRKGGKVPQGATACQWYGGPGPSRSPGTSSRLLYASHGDAGAAPELSTTTGTCGVKANAAGAPSHCPGGAGMELREGDPSRRRLGLEPGLGPALLWRVGLLCPTTESTAIPPAYTSWGDANGLFCFIRRGPMSGAACA